MINNGMGMEAIVVWPHMKEKKRSYLKTQRYKIPFRSKFDIKSA